MAYRKWTISEICEFGYPIMDFSCPDLYLDTYDRGFRDGKGRVRCRKCNEKLQFYAQPHFCEGFITVLNVMLQEYYPECPRCACVLVHPAQPHRCPTEEPDSEE